ncbi:MAG: winged helix-turn-helix domain-containing protein [Nitrosotalea sp.]
MQRNLGWIEIIDTILEVSEKRTLTTHVMYRCSLNSKQIKQYIQFLLDHRMIENVSDLTLSKRPIYKITK